MGFASMLLHLYEPVAKCLLSSHVMMLNLTQALAHYVFHQAQQTF